jgi:hypothetical protein
MSSCHGACPWEERAERARVAEDTHGKQKKRAGKPTKLPGALAYV